MVYLSGAVRAAVAIEPHFGFLVTPSIGNRLPQGVTWAADTGCFKHPEGFNLDNYLRWLARKEEQAGTLPLFVTAPDVVANAEDTWKRAAPVLPVLRREGWLAALVAQDGLTIDSTPWDEFDCLFIGGSTEWKESRTSAELIAAARIRGKQAHVGRVNTPERLQFSARAGATSVDGAKLVYGFDANWPELREWVRCLNAQRSFSFLAA